MVSQISSDAMWSREVSVLLEFCARWAAQDDLPELCCRMLNRLKTTDVRAEPLLLTLTDKQGPVFDKLRKAMNRERDWEIAGHMSQVWSPGLMDTLRLCIGLSYNRTMWLESAFKYDWDVNGEGHKVKHRHMIAPDSEVPLPSPFVVARMREVGPELLSGEAENVQSDDWKAALRRRGSKMWTMPSSGWWRPPPGQAPVAGRPKAPRRASMCSCSPMMVPRCRQTPAASHLLACLRV